MKDKQQALILAKELQEYTRVVGSHNQKINQTADELVECLGSPSLTEDQQVVLEWLKENGNPNEPFSALDELTGEVFYTEGFKTCIYVAFNNLTGKQQFQVLAAFAEWGCKSSE